MSSKSWNLGMARAGRGRTMLQMPMHCYQYSKWEEVTRASVAKGKRRDCQVERTPPDPDHRAVRADKTIEHSALMRGTLVKDVDILTNQIGDPEIRQVASDLWFRFRKKLLKC